MSIPESGAGSLVIIPTYNERENLPIILGKLFDAVPEANVLIVDDGSPDGTGELADDMAQTDPRITTMHRTGKLGLGTAYLAGFAEGIARGYEFLIELDADGSHPPQKLPEMLGVAAADPSIGLVIGSRWTAGGSVVDWPKRREFLSRGANAYAGFMLGIDVKDATAGFRVYRSSLIASLDLNGVDSKGYCFQIDMTLRTVDAGVRIVEVPIEFRDRELGQSKMSGDIIIEAMRNVTVWGIQRHLPGARRRRVQR
ncbi:MAG TPA: polyprenol monophosphomannose synthase [Microbacteriaceae bacterium]|nr:polyprenol monophosphomannose synthase [Microbacteriaceae bacterium]